MDIAWKGDDYRTRIETRKKKNFSSIVLIYFRHLFLSLPRIICWRMNFGHPPPPSSLSAPKISIPLTHPSPMELEQIPGSVEYIIVLFLKRCCRHHPSCPPELLLANSSRPRNSDGSFETPLQGIVLVFHEKCEINYCVLIKF